MNPKTGANTSGQTFSVQGFVDDAQKTGLDEPCRPIREECYGEEADEGDGSVDSLQTRNVESPHNEDEGEQAENDGPSDEVQTLEGVSSNGGEAV